MHEWSASPCIYLCLNGRNLRKPTYKNHHRARTRMTHIILFQSTSHPFYLQASYELHAVALEFITQGEERSGKIIQQANKLYTFVKSIMNTLPSTGRWKPCDKACRCCGKFYNLLLRRRGSREEAAARRGVSWKSEVSLACENLTTQQ